MKFPLMLAADDPAPERVIANVVHLKTGSIAETVDQIKVLKTHDWTTCL